MNKIILGLFQTYETASHVFDDLVANGYSPRDISIVSREDTLRTLINDNKDNTKGIGDAAAAGGIIGGLLGLLAGTGAIVIPGLGALLIAGPIAAAFGLTGVAATTASGVMTGLLAGGLIGALKELGLDEIKATTFSNKIKEGFILLAISCVERDEDKVRSKLELHKAEHITTLDLKE